MLNLHRFGAFVLVRALTRGYGGAQKEPRKRGAPKFLLASLSVKNWAVLVAIARPGVPFLCGDAVCPAAALAA
jgi:hypothetical protein